MAKVIYFEHECTSDMQAMHKLVETDKNFTLLDHNLNHGRTRSIVTTFVLVWLCLNILLEIFSLTEFFFIHRGKC